MFFKSQSTYPHFYVLEKSLRDYALPSDQTDELEMPVVQVGSLKKGIEGSRRRVGSQRRFWAKDLLNISLGRV